MLDALLGLDLGVDFCSGSSCERVSSVATIVVCAGRGGFNPHLLQPQDQDRQPSQPPC